MAFRNEHLSFSRLQRFEQCPLSFKLHYIDKWRTSGEFAGLTFTPAHA